MDTENLTVTDSSAENGLTPTVNTEVETEAENTASNVEGFNLDEYVKMAKGMINGIEKALTTLKRSTITALSKEFNLSYGIIEKILPYTKEDIDAWSIDEAVEFYNKYVLTENNRITTDNAENIYETLHKVKDYSLDIFKAEYDLEKVNKSSNDFIAPYVAELRKADTIASRKERLEKLKSEVESETDPIKKLDYYKVIKTLESLITYDFLFKRFDDMGDKALNRDVDQFLNASHGGNYIIDRFTKRIKRLKFKEDIYKVFFNIEETFLPEEYHVFNNLFLFVYMKFIAYIDVYNNEDVTYAERLTSAIMNLVYHQFANIEDEQAFIEIVRKVDDRFIEYHEIFETCNSTYKNSEMRIKTDMERIKAYREDIISKLHDLRVTDIDDTISNEDLINLLVTTKQNLIISQIDTESDIIMNDVSYNSDNPTNTTDSNSVEKKNV